MKVTVTQFSDATPEDEWANLVEHTRDHGSEVVLLGEMPFSPWLAATDEVDAARWDDAVRSHDQWIARLDELNGAAVAGSRPVVIDGTRYNQGFWWSPAAGYHATHLKYYLPDEPGFWEATWYRRSPQKSFVAANAGRAMLGYMICTDMWFTEHARSYARQGVDLLLVPRATEGATAAKWLAGGRAAAVMSGAFCLSSNRHGLANGVLFGAQGWVIDPDGNVIVTTSDTEPFATVDVDLDLAKSAKRRYPRYVSE